MSFIKKVIDEVHDENIDRSKLPKKPVIDEKIDMDDPTKMTEASMAKAKAEEAEAEAAAERAAAEKAAAEKAEEKAAAADPDFPDHPDYIALKPHLTERELWRMPAIRFYSTIIGLCVGMILYGIINGVLDLGMTKGAVGWYQIFGAAVGFMLSREVFEPRLRIPFHKGTCEQKKAATEEYLARNAALDAQIERMRQMQEESNEKTK